VTVGSHSLLPVCYKSKAWQAWIFSLVRIVFFDILVMQKYGCREFQITSLLVQETVKSSILEFWLFNLLSQGTAMGKCEPWNIYMHAMFRNSSGSWGAYFTGLYCYSCFSSVFHLLLAKSGIFTCIAIFYFLLLLALSFLSLYIILLAPHHITSLPVLIMAWTFWLCE
jgi:hypothetical protein